MYTNATNQKIFLGTKGCSATYLTPSKLQETDFVFFRRLARRGSIEHSTGSHAAQKDSDCNRETLTSIEGARRRPPHERQPRMSIPQIKLCSCLKHIFEF